MILVAVMNVTDKPVMRTNMTLSEFENLMEFMGPRTRLSEIYLLWRQGQIDFEQLVKSTEE